ncbi:hypothetical protein CDD83_3502 [Cordyceps sp. RAO-2017]|nr:hypothetical protein CDD83_3502 [Cordyceps sp. RAO-2017]
MYSDGDELPSLPNRKEMEQLAAKPVSDLTIVCGTSKWFAHKAVVCPQSAFFAVACNGPFKVSSHRTDVPLDEQQTRPSTYWIFKPVADVDQTLSPQQEGRSGVVDLADDEPQAVRLMMCYFYQADYPRVRAAREPSRLRSLWHFVHGSLVDDTGGDDDSNLAVHAQVYALAEKYAVDGLKRLARYKFQLEAAGHWRSRDFARAAEMVFTSTVDADRGLRDIVVDAFDDHRSLLHLGPSKAALRRVPGLAYDVLMGLHDPTAGWDASRMARARKADGREDDDDDDDEEDHGPA